MTHFLYFANIQSLLNEPLNENNRILIFIFNELYELHEVISIFFLGRQEIFEKYKKMCYTPDD